MFPNLADVSCYVSDLMLENDSNFEFYRMHVLAILDFEIAGYEHDRSN